MKHLIGYTVRHYYKSLFLVRIIITPVYQLFYHSV